jgi:hypothetical protein
MGAYHGLDGFRTFSKTKGVLLQNSLVGAFLGRLFKPPYNVWTDRAIAFLMGRGKARGIQKMSRDNAK